MKGNRARRGNKNQLMALAPAVERKKRRTRFALRPAVLLVPMVAIGAIWTGSQAPRLFTGSDIFQLKALEVSGLRVLTGMDILDASGLQRQDNVFAVDLQRVQGYIEKLPWVRTALVWRRPPDRLAIDIVERRRVAWIDLGEVFGLDAEGVLLPGSGMRRESFRELDLPVITGLEVEMDPLHPGLSVADSTLERLLDWWQQASAAEAEFCLNISEIQPLPPGSIRLRLVGDGLEVRLPADRTAERLRVLKRLMGQIYREYPNPAYVDMRYAGQVVVGGKEPRR